MQKTEEDIPKETCPMCCGKRKIRNTTRVEKRKGWLKKSRWKLCYMCSGTGFVDWITFMKGK